MARDKSDPRFSFFRQFDQRAGNNLLTAEGFDLRGFTEHPRRIILSHIGDPQDLLAVLIVDDDQVFICAKIIFNLQLASAGEVPVGVDSLDLDLPFAGEFVLF